MMKIKILFFLFAFSLCLSHHANAQTEEACYKNTSSHYNQIVCAQKEFSSQDRILNEQYNKFLSTLKSKKLIKLLNKSEKSWVFYRNKYCKFIGMYYSGGSVAPFVFNDCLRNLTNNRDLELQMIMSNDEYNLDSNGFKKATTDREHLKYSERYLYRQIKMHNEIYQEEVENINSVEVLDEKNHLLISSSFKNSEAEWSSYRDRHCNFVSVFHADDNKIAKRVYRNNCIARLTKSRAADIKNFIELTEE